MQISGLRRLSTALLQDKALIDGKWVSAASGKTFEVYNPATGSIIAHVPDMDSTDAQKSIEAAKKAFYSEEWSGLTAKERSGLLKVSLLQQRSSQLTRFNQFNLIEMVSIARAKSPRDCCYHDRGIRQAD